MTDYSTTMYDTSCYRLLNTWLCTEQVEHEVYVAHIGNSRHEVPRQK